MNLEKCAELFEPFAGGTLYAGFSGGADSTALLLVMQELQSRFRYRLAAVHFDHGLRGEESCREAENAENFARGRGVEFLKYSLELSPGPNLEAEARAARFRVWKELASGRPGVGVALGHHADDCAETLLLRLARGSNFSGLAALRTRSVVDGVTLLRPLLGFRRLELEVFLRERGIGAWAMDSSNADDRFVRNALRNRILPALYAAVPGSAEGVLRSLEVLGEDADFLEREARRRLSELDGIEETPLEFWKRLHPALLVRVLRGFVAGRSGHDFIPNRALLERLRREWAVPDSGARRIPLDGERFLELRNATLRLWNPAPELSPAVWRRHDGASFFWNGFELRAEPVTVVPEITLFEALFDADALPPELMIDRRREGDRMIPFGGTAPVSLKKLRIDRKLPADCPYPVLRDASGSILWAPGIRHSAGCSVTHATRKIVKLSLNR